MCCVVPSLCLLYHRSCAFMLLCYVYCSVRHVLIISRVLPYCHVFLLIWLLFILLIWLYYLIIGLCAPLALPSYPFLPYLFSVFSFWCQFVVVTHPVWTSLGHPIISSSVLSCRVQGFLPIQLCRWILHFPLRVDFVFVFILSIAKANWTLHLSPHYIILTHKPDTNRLRTTAEKKASENKQL